MTFGTVPLNTFKFGSKKIAIPIELLQDTNVDILALVNKRIRDRIGRIANRSSPGQPARASRSGVTSRRASARRAPRARRSR
jgi:hypothetical protein